MRTRYFANEPNGPKAVDVSPLTKSWIFVLLKLGLSVSLILMDQVVPFGFRAHVRVEAHGKTTIGPGVKKYGIRYANIGSCSIRYGRDSKRSRKLQYPRVLKSLLSGRVNAATGMTIRSESSSRSTSFNSVTLMDACTVLLPLVVKMPESQSISLGALLV